MSLFKKKPEEPSFRDKIAAYSQGVDPALAALIRGIRGKHDCFATKFFPYGNPDAQGLSAAAALKAWEDPNTKLWQVEQWTYFPKGYLPDTSTDSFRGEQLTRIGLCFFDALRICSQFHADEQKHGKNPVFVPGKQWEITPLWQTAAKAADQAVDETGLVHPCANRRILTSGHAFFSLEETDRAAKSAPAESAPDAQPAIPLSALFQNLSAVAPDDNGGALLAQAADKRARIALYDAVLGAGRALARVYSKIVGYGFKPEADFTSYYLALGALATLGVYPLVSYCQGNHDLFPVRAFGKALSAFNKAAAALPREDDKALCREFARKTEFAFWIARAKVEHKERLEKGKPVQSGFSYVEKAAAAINSSPAELAQLKARYLIDGFASEEFALTTHDSWRFQIKDRLEKRKKSLAL